MFRLLLILLLINPVFGGEKGGHRIRVTPNLEEEEGLTLTSESNIYRSTLYQNIFIDNKTDNDWYYGIAMLNMPAIGGGAQNYEYDWYVNISKRINISDGIKVLIGSQNGTTAFNTQRQLHNFTFTQGIFEITPRLTVSSGVYYVNNALSIKGQALGATFGMNVKFIDKVLWSELEFQSGNTNVSGSVMNLFWKPMNEFAFYTGLQVPTTNSGNEFAGNLGIMFYPSELK